MYVVLGATGHVGSAVSDALLDRGAPVTVVTRDARKAERFRVRGARVAQVDVGDVDALRAVLASGERLFLLNPPASPATDTTAQERRTLAAIHAALEGSGIRKIVAQSTYGAQRGEAIGDLGVLHEMEQALAALPISTTIVRGAYYLSNWDLALETARDAGKLDSFYPVDFVLPMVAPRDLGTFAARLLEEPLEAHGLHHVEGPARHTAADVADAFAAALGRPVAAVEIPRDAWAGTFAAMGFSEPAAVSFAGMIDASLRSPPPDPASVTRGPTSLEAYVGALVRDA